VARRNRLVSVSELRTWCYCHKAWNFERRGYPSSLFDERIAGTNYHQSRDRALRAASRTRTATAAVMIVCALGMIAIAMRSLFLP
jgi:hypothetical protein